jgi:hypothetical protein
MRRAAKRDDAEAAVMHGFLDEGAKHSVVSLTQLSGKDLPDLLVGFLGVNHVVEVKTGNARLRPGQISWAELWCGEKPVVARTEAQARKWIRTWLARRPTLNTVLTAEQATK